MKPSVAAMLLSLGLAPPAAHAQAAEAPPAAAAPAADPTAPWSVGAGVGWGAVYGSSYAYLGSLATSPPTAPTVRASLERAVAPGWWLELGFTGSASRLRGEKADASALISAGAYTRDDQVLAAVNLGARHALTRPGAPVCVSMDLALVAGYYASHVDLTLVETVTSRSEAFTFGLTAGLAVERELISGLSLRVGTSLASASWSRGRTENTTTGEVTQDGASASLTLSPWLELRQAF